MYSLQILMLRSLTSYKLILNFFAEAHQSQSYQPKSKNQHPAS